MQLGGTIVSKEFPKMIDREGKPPYEGWEIMYKTEEGEVKPLRKPSLSFTKGPLASSLKASFDALQVGDKFTYVIEKDDTSGYYELRSMNKGDLPVPFKKEWKKSGGGFASKNDPEIQKYIIRQSSISAAVNSLKTDKAVADPDRVLEVAAQYEAWVTRSA